ncbi:DUF2285 domain-containing protein [Ferrovibrio sp.]|uniref:DUF2285 domain-containing protein n=1 Tax=Ferrovibrio sp. TaxID=1917215 RepID=UPI00311F7A76
MFSDADTNGRQHILLASEGRSVQIVVDGASVLDGPVQLHWQLTGLAHIKPQLYALHHLVAWQRYGRFPKSAAPPITRLDRLINALRAVDADQMHVPLRQIADTLFGPLEQSDWRGQSDYLRSQIRRLIRTGRRLVTGDYRHLLKK